MGLHLGWIPNEPGLRPREFDRPSPAEPAPDPGKVAALRAAEHARGLWSRVLIVIGLFPLILFGLMAEFAHARWAWAVAVGLALCCWLPVVLLGRGRRRAAARLRAETDLKATEHAGALAEYEQGKARWAEAESERIAGAPRWLQVAAHEETRRLDVFGGTGAARQNMVTGIGGELLADRAVIVLDLSQDRVADGLLAAAARSGLSWQDYELPRDLAETPLLAGLTGDQVASLIVEVVHADDAGATAAGRATDLMILRKIAGQLGPDISLGRLHAALALLLGDDAAGDPAGPAPAGPADEAGPADPAAPGNAPGGSSNRLSAGERAGLHSLFGDGFRHQVAGNLVRLAAVVEPLTGLGSGPGPRPAARLTCLSLAGGPRDVTADLTAALVVQWVTRAVSAEDGPQPAVILAGADEQSTRHLARLTAVCERLGIPLVRAFSRLTEESARHLDSRHTAFLRLATRPEALRAAEHIGLERRFVAGRFAQRHSVSRSRTRTTSDSVSHTSGRTEGGATTHTVGTTTGQAYSEAEVPRHDPKVNVQMEERSSRSARSSRSERLDGEDRRGDGRDGRDGQARGSSGGGAGGRGSGGARESRENRESKENSTRRVSATQGGGSGVDIVKTRTRFSAKHESDSTTKSWSTTEETSHTSTTARSRTDGISIGDEISYELVYDHKVQPETLMALPEDQMLAPHIVEAAPGTGSGAAAAVAAGGGAESKMVALVIDPEVVGGEPVAAVRPGEIPAFEPPVPQISAQVPDYERVPRRGSLPVGGAGHS